MIRLLVRESIGFAFNVFCFAVWCSGAKGQELGSKWFLLEAAKFVGSCTVLGLVVFGLISLGSFLASKGCDQ